MSLIDKRSNHPGSAKATGSRVQVGFREQELWSKIWREKRAQELTLLRFSIKKNVRPNKNGRYYTLKITELVFLSLKSNLINSDVLNLKSILVETEFVYALANLINF